MFQELEAAMRKAAEEKRRTLKIELAEIDSFIDDLENATDISDLSEALQNNDIPHE